LYFNTIDTEFRAYMGSTWAVPVGAAGPEGPAGTASYDSEQGVLSQQVFG
jgi:hypothetical protein